MRLKHVRKNSTFHVLVTNESTEKSETQGATVWSLTTSKPKVVHHRKMGVEAIGAREKN